MKSRDPIFKISPIVMALSLVACGGGSGGTDVAGIDGSGAPAVASGPVSGFGSILLNGRRYIVENDTSVLVDGNSVMQTELQVGQFVTISSSSVDDNGNPIADLVRSDTIIEGPITSIDIVGGSVTVLNQQVRINDETKFDDDLPDRSINGLAISDVIEVTGIQNNSGVVLATRIELDDDGDDFKLVGPVADLDEDAQEFTVNGLTVSYFGATLDDMPGGSLSNGDVVKVEGTLNVDVLDAEEVEGFDDVFGSVGDNEEIEIKGTVTRFVSAEDFDVNGIQVSVTGETEFEDGSIDAVALNVALEVEGYFDDGTLVADEISFEREDNIEMSGIISGIAATNASLNQGGLTILNIDVTTNAFTTFEDSSVSEIFDFGFDDLNLGDYVVIEGYLSENNDIVITELEREEASNEIEIEGPLEAKNLPDSITLLGRVFDTSSIDTGEIAEAAIGVEISIEGTLIDGNFVIDEVSVED
mgnify:CR=1 FL=1|tara:strand:- start:5011 stop:6429 length:1419 start_codon:yes stop_codon:yes gene_type:complete